MTSDLVLGLGTLVRRLQSLEGEGMLRDLHLLRVPAWKATSSACKPGGQGLGKPEKSPSFSVPLPPATLLPCLLCVLWCPIPQSSVGKTLHQQQQDNKGHVSERTGGGRGKGDFGSNTSSFRASVLPSTPSSLSQMGLDSELEAALEIIQPAPSLSHMRELKPTDVKWPA